ncbi:helix-turn-helix domain-containing protein [Rhizobium oryzicola]|uniref:Helix-turn-helix transcriptional regulator n=1 Tax=Rhizobium oryzicola TaxID=1232668 RepID=A0ABT8STM9_9HYPH|nr:helix-turn-helix transcriptional regulator [Rhizobium oryzicola]MDO1581785.1 helix-turn-helix transcriptional regulator [Rhizobium oryzicola]
MITTEQLRAARAALNLSIDDVATRCGVAADVIVSAEQGPSGTGGSTIERLRAFYESLGVTFLAAGQDGSGLGAGIRLRTSSHDEGLRPQDLTSEDVD